MRLGAHVVFTKVSLAEPNSPFMVAELQYFPHGPVRSLSSPGDGI